MVRKLALSATAIDAVEALWLPLAKRHGCSWFVNLSSENPTVRHDAHKCQHSMN